MDAKHLTPFVDAAAKVLQQHTISDVKKGSVIVKNNMNVEQDITSVVSFSGGIRGNVSYSLSVETAVQLLSFLDPACPVNPFGAAARSFWGNIVEEILSKASQLLLEYGILITPSLPTVVSGRQMLFVISSVQTIAVHIQTPFGPIEVNIGLEE